MGLGMPQVADAKRFELIDQIARCRDFLPVLRDPAARKTVEDLMIYLEAKLRAITQRQTGASESR